MTYRMPDSQGARRSPAGIAAVVIAIAMLIVAIGLYQASGHDTAPTAAPSLPALRTAVASAPLLATPAPTEATSPTVDPGSARACQSGQLALVAGGWGGATGSMAGGATVLNVSSDVCLVSGTPALELRDATGKVIADGEAAAPGDTVVLAPGAVANVTTVWRNWCKEPPSRPLSIRVSLDDPKVRLTAEVVDWDSSGVGGSESSSLPRCDVETAPSTIVAPLPLAAPEPAEPTEDIEPCTPDSLVALLGSWGGAGGSLHAPALVFNQGGSDCEVDASPPLELRDANRRLVTTGDPWPGAGKILAPAGWAVVTWIDYADWCLPRPKLPLRLNLVVAGDRVGLRPTSDRSTLGLPACNSEPPSNAPDLGYDGPFELPAR